MPPRSSRVNYNPPKAVSSSPNLKVEGLVKGLMAEITEDYSVEVCTPQVDSVVRAL